MFLHLPTPPSSTTLLSLENKAFFATLSKKCEATVLPSISFPKLSKVVTSVSGPVAAKPVESKQIVVDQLPSVLKAELMPNHVAVIVDGNRRWAVERNLPPIDGHSAGRRTLKELARMCNLWGVKVLTVFLFSTENWTRPQDEVNSLLDLLENLVNSDPGDDIQLSILGNRSMLPNSFQKVITEAEEARKNNSGLQFNIAINYSGRYDILNACKGIADKVKDGVIEPVDINENLFEQELQTKFTDFPCPDLLIRTSGELRVSNFLLWQLAYTELYFVETMFPDFGEAEFIEALSSFQKRKRRYGGHKY